jgi:thiol-disulfide isomerase/thioredoxin
MKVVYLYILAYSVMYQALGQQPMLENDSMAVNFLKGKPAPEIKITTIEKKSYTLGKSEGKITVVNFWFIACGPCRKELPMLTELVNSYGKQSDIRFVSISNIDTETSLRYVKKRLGLKFELVAQGQKAADSYHVMIYPTNFIIDRNGYVVFAEMGFHDDISERMKTVIDELRRQ